MGDYSVAWHKRGEHESGEDAFVQQGAYEATNDSLRDVIKGTRDTHAPLSKGDRDFARDREGNRALHRLTVTHVPSGRKFDGVDLNMLENGVESPDEIMNFRNSGQWSEAAMSRVAKPAPSRPAGGPSHGYSAKAATPASSWLPGNDADADDSFDGKHDLTQYFGSEYDDKGSDAVAKRGFASRFGSMLSGVFGSNRDNKWPTNYTAFSDSSKSE